MLYRDRLDPQGHRNIVIETMGFDDQDYLVRKDRTHRRMAELGPLIQLDMSRPLDQSRATAFQHDIMAIAQRILAVNHH